jgi:hypothetical protein
MTAPSWDEAELVWEGCHTSTCCCQTRHLFRKAHNRLVAKSGHHLGYAWARVAVQADRSELVHTGAVVADVTVNLNVDPRVESAGDRLRSARVYDRQRERSPGS